MFMRQAWHGAGEGRHPAFGGSPILGEGPVVGLHQLDGGECRSDAQSPACLVGMGLDGFDADIEHAGSRLGAMMAADLAQDLDLALTQFFDA